MMISWSGADSKGPFTAVGDVLYLKKDRVLAESVVSSSKWWIKLEQALTVLVMIACYPLYLKGFKHNQVIFFLQTLAFMSFALKDEEYVLVESLYELRLSYLGFGNIFNDTVFAPNYLEPSTGNFPQLTTDSNILRVAGTPLAVAVTIAGLCLLLRTLTLVVMSCEICRSKCSCVFVVLAMTKKPVYRTMEFIYKTCMYPLLFFSVVTLQQWGSVVFVGPQFKQLCNIIAAVLIGGYLIVTIWQTFFETVANISKLENLSEFLSAALSSIIIVLGIHNNFYLLLIAVALLRAAAYIIIRVRYFRGFTRLEFIRLGSALLECLTMCLTLTGSLIGLWVSAILTIGVMLTHEVLVLYAIDAKIDQNRQATVSEGADSSSLEFKEENQTSAFDQLNASASHVSV
jgi:hypothetical protein